MAIHLFESIDDPTIKAFTVDPSGANLPDKHGPWHPSGSGNAIATGNVSAPVAVLLERDGYFIAAARTIH